MVECARWAAGEGEGLEDEGWKEGAELSIGNELFDQELVLDGWPVGLFRRDSASSDTFVTEGTQIYVLIRSDSHLPHLLIVFAETGGLR